MSSREPTEIGTRSQTAKIIRIDGLKEWVGLNLPSDSKLRDLILRERDVLRAEEFISKLESWLLLAVNDGTYSHGASSLQIHKTARSSRER